MGQHHGENGHHDMPDLFGDILGWKCYGPVPLVANGHVSSGEIDFAVHRFIFCNPGYINKGARTVYCQADGQWSAPGTCVICKF